MGFEERTALSGSFLFFIFFKNAKKIKKLKVVEMMFEKRQDYKNWRKRNNVRLWDVSKYINLSEGTISRWENDMRDIPDWKIELYDRFIQEYEKANDK
ncbi:helix-turn-helix domain-containing protein [Acetivibrio thermocellus]|uniref:helix-turn-helix domain-containing protein n=1 Tax=Acetivibrio thermocellus TaxID=1515 RepID=UPI0010A5BCF2|nr:helix-turn-helix transcriptional regulator [Acetivibrio thermocellus]THJ78608.1 XRE family transcriptional regulator [Acetivibrio thermocellus]